MKLSVSVLFALLVSGFSAFGQSFDLSMNQSVYPVNRKDNIVWFDVHVANSPAIKDLVFDLKFEYIQCEDFGAEPIPAECFGADGKKDESKWTQPTSKSTGFEFHYWMDPGKAADFLAESSQLRKIMSFFLKTKKTIPTTGQLKVIFDNFRVTDASGKSLPVPTSRSIIIELGNLPPSELNLRLVNAQVSRTETLNLVNLDLEYSGKSFDSLAADLILPSTWPKPVVSPAVASVTGLGNGKWRLVMNAVVPASSDYKKLFSLTLNFPADSRGPVELKLNNFLAQSAGKALTTATEISLAVDLKEPFSMVTETVKFLADASAPIVSLDKYKLTGYGELITGLKIDNLDKKIRSVTFQLTVADYMSLDNVVSSFDGSFGTVKKTSSTVGTNSYLVELVAKSFWPANLATDNPKLFAILNFRFTDLPYGFVNLKIENIIAKDSSGKSVNSTKLLDWTMDMKPIFVSFKKGDSDDNFGNAKLDQADLTRLIDYLAGRLKNPKLYQLWAFDFNGDGTINQKDVDELLKKISTNSVDEILVKSMIKISSYGLVNYQLDELASLVIYSSAGQLLYSDKLDGSGSIQLNLASGAYFWRLSTTSLTGHGSVLITK